MTPRQQMTIRDETLADRGAIRSVNQAAFQQPDEGDLVDRLREEGVALGSHVAEHEGQIVGHILFSRMSIETATGASC